ncbi:thioredoxin family protein [Mycobacterium sp. pUA109]|uniref:thioredoxin family protein n=1 Tax=Mycobacterium sp. pUA109 TaxID=3238982 RepID=UPI00351B02FE
MTALVAIAAGLALATAAGWLLRRRSGVLMPTDTGPVPAELGLSTSGPTVVHFSAAWCGPCAAVRRVVDQVCTDLDVAHVEIDLDADPGAARALSVLSLPTTFIFDAQGRQRFRTAGVPTVAGLREALQPLLA